MRPGGPLGKPVLPCLAPSHSVFSCFLPSLSPSPFPLLSLTPCLFPAPLPFFLSFGASVTHVARARAALACEILKAPPRLRRILRALSLRD